MKTLSIKNPWAYLIAFGLKDIENRSWHTNIRGTVLIHASAAMHERYLPNVRGGCFTGPCASKINHAGIAPKIISNELIYSAIIGKMDIVDCISNSKSIWAEEGQYHWVIKNAVLFKEPVLNVKGKLSFWDFDLPDYVL